MKTFACRHDVKAWLAGLALFAALTTPARAATITATVVDAITKRPVAGADVTMTLSSGAQPLRTTTDREGRFTVETDVIPISIVVSAGRYERYVISTSNVSRAGVTGLVIALTHRMLPLDTDFHPRQLCGAFQPAQLWDRYDLVPGGVCGTQKS
jgi:hypothetical protein